VVGLGELVEAASKAFTSIGQMPEGVTRRAWNELNPFLTRLGQAITARWMPHVAQQIPCAVRATNAPPCPNLSVTHCIACGEPTCPFHACVDHTGSALCFACVGIAVHVRKQAPPPPPGETREAAKERARAEAYRTLGLEPGVSFEVVRKRHRKLVKLHHPDRNGDLELCKRINAAFELLKAEFEAKRKAA
jgi:hypothetical protein